MSAGHGSRTSHDRIGGGRSQRTRVRAWAAVLAIVLFATDACIKRSSLSPGSGPWRFSGTITSVSGGRIAGARLIVLDGPNSNVQTTTDAAGNYVFQSLESGRFSVLIEAHGFVSITPQVDLFRDVEATFALTAAP
jgi:hypothetical protein